MKPWASLALALLAVPLIGAADAPPDAGKRGEVLWDTWGVPHIHARDEAGAFWGFGWAQAHSHGNILLKMYGESRARGAEYWGAAHAAEDRWLIANDVPQRAALWFKAQSPQMRANLEAFADGINAYARAHPGAIAPEFAQVLPLSGVDIMAHAHRLMQFQYVAPRQRMLAAGEAPSVAAPPPASPAQDGSNAWALAPARSKAGHTMLLANPHLPWAPGPLTYYEAQIVAPGYSVYGATQVGLPVLRFAFNDNLGFTNTVNQILGQARYRLVLKDGGYVLDGRVRPFRVERKAYKVRQADGSLQTVEFDQRYSIHGPVFDLPDGTTIALKMAGLDRPGVLQQYLDMGKARDFKGFMAAMQRHQVPTFNIVYADRAGHIAYFDNGITPRHRDGGDHAHWSAPVAGDTSRTIFRDVLGFAEMPAVIDPPTGFVQNANDGPWVATWPRAIDPARYAAHIAPAEPIGMRPQQSVRLLMGDAKFDFDDFRTSKLTTRALLAERLVPELLRAAAGSDDPDIKAAAAVLTGWDLRFEPDARAPLLFEAFAERFVKGGDGWAVPWSADAPVDTPRGLKDPAAALAQLKAAVADVVKAHGRIDRPYGEATRLQLPGVDLPAHGGSGPLGLFRTFAWSGWQGGQRHAVHGETWVNLIEFSTPVRAVAVMSYGNATQPGTAHRSDQLPLVAARQFRELWLTRAAVEQHLERVDRY